MYDTTDVCMIPSTNPMCLVHALKISDMLPIQSKLLDREYDSLFGTKERSIVVRNIILHRAPFKVLGAIIVRVLVLMIYYRQVVRVRDEGICYKSAHKKAVSFFMELKQHYMIPLIIDIMFEDTAAIVLIKIPCPWRTS